MTHLRDLEKKCSEPYCNSAAKVVLMSYCNQDYGSYCRKHGKSKLRWLQNQESRGQ